MIRVLNTNDTQLTLPTLYVGLRSTLLIGLASILEDATDVMVIMNGLYAYNGVWNPETKMWDVAVLGGQFLEIGMQKYEIAYKWNDNQYYDGQGWVKVVEATNTGIVPEPELPTVPRYLVLTVNGVRPNANGNVNISNEVVRNLFQGQTFSVDTARDRADALTRIITTLGGTVE